MFLVKNISIEANISTFSLISWPRFLTQGQIDLWNLYFLPHLVKILNNLGFPNLVKILTKPGLITKKKEIHITFYFSWEELVWWALHVWDPFEVRSNHFPLINPLKVLFIVFQVALGAFSFYICISHMVCRLIELSL